MAGNTLEEFLNDNLHRNYPIKDGSSAQDTTGNINIPSDLIADIRISVPTTYSTIGRYFVSSIIVSGYTLSIGLSYESDTGVVFDVGSFQNITQESPLFSSFLFTAAKQIDPEFKVLEDIVGTLVTGNTTDLGNMVGAYVFFPDDTELVPTCIDGQLAKFRAIQIEDTMHTGNIILKEGDNVTLSTNYDSATDTTTITISTAQIESASIQLTDDASIIEALTQLYGTPITHINEIPPKDSGNFILKGADCVTIGESSSGAIITNPCGTPCCDQDTFVSPIYNSINQLNARDAHLEDYMKEMTSTANTIINRLKDLENMVGVGGF